MQHFIRQVEKRREEGWQRKNPAWLVGLMEEIAEMLEPGSGEARVGYVCQPSAGEWQVDLFLGATELVGGQKDGELLRTGFQLDVQRLLGRFESVMSCQWQVPESSAGIDPYLETRGIIEGQPVNLRVLSRASASVEPGMRLLQDGSLITT